MADFDICVDDNLKKQAEIILSDIGLTLSSATTLFLKQVIRCNGIPFELETDPFYSAENQTRLLSAKNQIESTGGTIHEIIKIDD